MSSYRDSYYRDDYRERDWDEVSYRSDRPKTYTTVHRYKVPDRASDRTRSSRYDDEEVDVRVTRHEGDRTDSRDYRYDYDQSDRRSSRDIRYSRDERDHDGDYYRERTIEREVARDPQRTRTIERERDDHGLERYTRSTEYYAAGDRQPIIIRNEAAQPIIIREREREPEREIAIREKEKVEEKDDIRSHVSEFKDKESIRESVKESVHDDRTTVASRREDMQVAVVPDPEEDYYFERRTRQVARRSSEDDERHPRRERRRSSFSSDDEYYYKKTETYDDEAPRHRRHLAEGAVLGAGAAALINHHKKKQGEAHGGIGQTIGGAAIGAIGAEAISRAKDYYERSRSRPAREHSRERRHHSSDESDRSRSRSRGGGYKKLGAMAAFGALATYALSRRNKDVGEERRSRSRRRRGSPDNRSVSSGGGSDREARTRSRSKSRGAMAKAGLASAAVIGLVDRARSKSKGRSRSALRSALPAAAAGVGGAALAGLYERKKGKKADRAVEEDHGRSRGYSDSRSRDADGYSEGARNVSNADRGMIEYGENPIPPNEQYRSQSHDNYYNDDRRRRRGSDASSTSSSPRRPHHRDREADAMGGGMAGVAAHEASQRRDRKRAERERRRQNDDAGQPGQYNFGPYAQDVPPTITNEHPPQAPFPPQQQQQYYPQASTYQPPNAYAPMPNFTNAPQPVPAQHFDYGHNNGYPGPSQEHQNHDEHAGYPQFPQQQARGQDSPSPYGDPNNKYRPPDNYVSSGPSNGVDSSNEKKEPVISSTASSPTPRSSSHTRGKSVQFDLDSTEYDVARPASDDGVVEERHAKEQTRRALHQDGEDHNDGSGEDVEEAARRHRRRSRDKDRENNNDGSDDEDRSEPKRHKHKKRRHSVSGGESRPSRSGRKHGRSSKRRSDSPDHNDSDETIELPARFDRDGRRKADRGEDPIADKIEDFLNGKGKAGRLFQKLTSDFTGGGSSSSSKR